MWSISKTLQIPLDEFSSIRELPHTLSYVIRKRQQVDNLMELPKEKRPPEYLIWHSNQDKLDNWLNDKLKSDRNEVKGNTIQVPHKKFAE